MVALVLADVISAGNRWYPTNEMTEAHNRVIAQILMGYSVIMVLVIWDLWIEGHVKNIAKEKTQWDGKTHCTMKHKQLPIEVHKTAIDKGQL